jgi:hypothetical protein
MNRTGTIAAAILLSLGFNIFAQNPVAERPSPNDVGINVGATPVLMWHAGLEATTNLLTNGGFEAGTTAWNVPSGANIVRGGANSAEGTNFLSVASGMIAREITLPETTAPILWSYAVKLPSVYVTTDPQVQNLSGELLKRGRIGWQGIHSGWTIYIVDISEFAGQTVRLAVNATPAPGTISRYSFDDFRVVALPAGLEFNVYFERGSEPRLPGSFLGRTTQPFLPLATRLSHNQTYLWRVDTIFEGVTNKGPTWRFTAAGGTVEPSALPGFESVPEVICPGDIVPLEIAFYDGFGFKEGAFLQSLAFAGAGADDAAAPSVVISELDTDENDGVEVINVSASAIDVSGWTLQLFARGQASAVQTLVLPDNVRLEPGEIFTARENETANAWPHLALAEMDWADDWPLYGGVILRDQSSNVVDCVFVTTFPSMGTAQKSGASIVDWPSVTVTNRTSAGATLQRRGNRDTNLRSDWIAAPSSMNALNADMQTPFARGFGKLDVTFNVITNSIGFFLKGEAQFHQPGSNVLLFAQSSSTSQSSPTVMYGSSARLQVVQPAYCLKLFAAQQMNENADKIPVRVSLGAPAVTDVTVKLRLVETNWVDFVTNVVVVAGQSELEVDLPGVNNDSLENTRTLSIKAQATNYAPDEVTIKAVDDEIATMTLSALREPVREGMFDLALEVSRAPDRDVRVRIAFDPPYPPIERILRAGTSRIEFAAPNDFRLQFNDRIKVTAEAGDWQPVSATFDFADDESRDLFLISNQPLIEGGFFEMTLKLGGTTLEPLEVSLTSLQPEIFEAPAVVRVEANLSEAKFMVRVPTNDLAESSHTVQVLATAPGFGTTTNTVEVFVTNPAPVLKAELVDGVMKVSFDTQEGWQYSSIWASEFNGVWNTMNSGWGGPTHVEFTVTPTLPYAFFIVTRQKP